MPTKDGKYSYYDTPDGQDSAKKCWYVSKILAKIGVVTATFDAFTISMPPTKLGVFGVYVRHISVLVGSGLAFVSASTIAQDLRGKDDEKNQVIGALASSVIFASAARNPWVFAVLAGVSTPIVHETKKYRMATGKNALTYDDPTRMKSHYFFGPFSHTLEIGKKQNTLHELYEQKNEEWHRQRKSQESEV